MSLLYSADGSSGELLENTVLSGPETGSLGLPFARSDESTGDALPSLSGFNEAVLIGRILYRLILLAAASVYLLEHMAGGCRVSGF